MSAVDEETVPALDSSVTQAALASADGTRRRRSPDGAPLLVKGDVVARYVVLESVGRGAMGEVYAAYDPKLDRRVALKLLKAVRGKSERAALRAQTEARTMAKITHPNVVAVFDVGEHAGRVFMAMEYIDGCTLTAWLAASTRSRQEIVDVFIAAGKGLAGAHDRRLVHCDFKPDNVLVGADGRVAVGDFGLAVPRASAPDDDDALPAAQRRAMPEKGVTFVGTPAYAAPEQHDRGPVGAAADQFSFCVALYEALYGERPFGGGSLVELASNITRGEMRPPPADADVPAALRRTLLIGLRTQPERRHASMHVLLAQLADNPWRRRRWLVVGGGAVAVTVATLATQSVLDARMRLRCDEESQALARVWNTDRRDVVEQAMLSTALPFAPTIFERTAVVLDRYVAAWGAVRRDTCLAHAPSEGEYTTHATACLSELSDYFSVYLDGVVEAAPASVLHALVGSNSLADPRRCLDPRWLQLRPAPPPGEAESVARLRLDIVRASSAWAMGDSRRQYELATAVLDEARLRGLPDLQASATLQIVGGLIGMARYAEAERIGEDGFFFAVELGSDRDAAAIATKLVYAVGYGLRRFDDAERWARLALMWHRRQPLDPTTLANLYNNRGTVRQARGDLPGAVVDYERAVRINLATAGESSPELVYAYINLANAAIFRYAPADATRWIERADEAAGSVFGEDHPVSSGIDEIRGNLAQLDRNPELAATYYGKSLAKRERALGRDHVAVATAHMNLGNALRSAGDMPAASEHFRRAVEITEAVSDSPAARQLSSLSILAGSLATLGKHDEARLYFNRALALVPSIDAASAEVVDAVHELAGLQNEYEGAQAAVETHGRVLGWLESGGGPPNARMARAQWSIASILLSEGDVGTAHEQIRRADAIARDERGPGQSLARSVAYTLGAVQIELGQLPQARESLARARRSVDAVAEPRNHAAIEITLAELDLLEGAWASAKVHIDAAAPGCPDDALEAFECRARIELVRAQLAWQAGDREAAGTRAQAARAAAVRMTPRSPLLDNRIAAWIEAHSG